MGSSLTAALLAACLVLGGDVALAAAPQYYEGFSYDITSFDESNYNSTFSLPQTPEVFLLADSDNFVVCHTTLFQRNAVTGLSERRQDILSMVETCSLEILRGARLFASLEPERYVFRQEPGPYGIRWTVFRGRQADAQYLEYLSGIFAYEQAKILQAAIAESLSAVPEPQKPAWSASPPQTGVVVRLPAGEYRIRAVDRAGRVFQGSEKRLIVFGPVGALGTGYELIPETRWTRRQISGLKGAVLYTDGSSQLFVKPYYQRSYIDRQVSLLRDLQSRGSEVFPRAIMLSQIPEATLHLQHNRREPAMMVHERPYLAEQTQEARLGYEIRELPAEEMQTTTPSFLAYPVAISPSTREMTIRLYSEDGEMAPDSQREIRVIRRRLPEAAFVLCLLPLGMPVVLRFRRQRSAGHRDEP